MILEVTEANFEQTVINAGKPVLLDFWAEWCGPCRQITPIVEELSIDYKDRAIIGKVDVDSSPGISAKYGIRNIPTILFIKNGQVVDRQVGAVPKSILAKKIEGML